MTFPAQVSSFTLSFSPQQDGTGYDPTVGGGGVDLLRLFTPGDDPTTATPIATASTPTKSSDGLTFTFGVGPVAWGIYQPYVTWRPTSDPAETVTALSLLGVPVPHRTVTAETVARRAGLTLPLSDADRSAIEDAIDDAEADALSVLNRRTLVPRLLVQAAAQSYRAPSGYELDETPVLALLSESPRSDGQFDVVYVGGLDVGGNPDYNPIERYVRAAAIEILRDQPRYRQLRTVRSLSNMGQSISYETNREALANAQGAGAPPTAKSISRWKRRGIATGRSRASLWGIYGGILPGGVANWDAGAAAEAWEMGAVGDARLPEAMR